MTWFQITTISLAGVLGLRSFVKALRATGRRARLVQLLFAGGWWFGVVCLARPEMTTAIARRLEIGRGADLILYGLALGSFWFAMFTYYKLSALKRDVTGIVRHLAIDAAQRGATARPEAGREASAPTTTGAVPGSAQGQ